MCLAATVSFIKVPFLIWGGTTFRGKYVKHNSLQHSLICSSTCVLLQVSPPTSGVGICSDPGPFDMFYLVRRPYPCDWSVSLLAMGSLTTKCAGMKLCVRRCERRLLAALNSPKSFNLSKRICPCNSSIARLDDAWEPVQMLITVIFNNWH